MTGLRTLAGRPIAEGERRGAFWIAAAILACAALALLLLPGGDTALAPPPEPASKATGAAPPGPAPHRAAPLAQPLATARRFLGGYLPFLYGRGAVRAIAAAAPSLRDRLAASRLRVPPAASDRHPRVAQIDGRRLAADRVLVTARVADGGPATYPISLTLARRNGRWLVIAEGTD
ncbi:MAG TPA: hypothetical protein VFN89_04115 [Solirubrobacterales bacterium]|nr:hypothetical protein [Solirubrobacterales bacterium]